MVVKQRDGLYLAAAIAELSWAFRIADYLVEVRRSHGHNGLWW